MKPIKEMTEKELKEEIEYVEYLGDFSVTEMAKENNGKYSSQLKKQLKIVKLSLPKKCKKSLNSIFTNIL